MLSFSVEIKSGLPIYEQIVYAVKKAFVEKQLQPGDKFPSVREMSKELRINPNTAQKVVTHLVNEGLLEIKPGIGSIVAQGSAGTDMQREKILNTQVEKLVVESKRLGIKMEELIEAVKKQWLKNEGETS